MKAIVITNPGAPDVLQLFERPKPLPGKNEVLIKVKAAGVNRPDIAQRKGGYPPPPGAPADIPGLEVSGIVEDCGEKVTRGKNGDKVCALLAGGGESECGGGDAGQCLPMPNAWSYVEPASLP